MGKINYCIRCTACLPIILYQYLISPIIRPCCRFSPSCSQYAMDAIKHFGLVKGLCLASKRLLRCNPWFSGGYDPIPPNDEKH